MELYSDTLLVQNVNKHNLNAISYIRETVIITIMNYTKASERAEYEMESTIT